MSTFAVGQKVETPFGNGEVVALGSEFNGVESYRVRFALPKDKNGYLHPIVEFPNYHLKPYKTPHERLLEMDYECSAYRYAEETKTLYVHENLPTIIIDNKTVSCEGMTLELSRILTDYLEWLEEQK